jgi:hypothetical protein
MGTVLLRHATKALWRVSAGWDTAHDGWMRGGVHVRGLGWYLYKYGETACMVRQLRPGCVNSIQLIQGMESSRS